MMDRNEKATKNGYVHYDFTSWEAPRIEEQSVQVGKRTRGREGSSIILTFAAVPVYSQTDQGRAEVSAILCDYDEYGGITVNQEPGSGYNLNTLLD